MYKVRQWSVTHSRKLESLYRGFEPLLIKLHPLFKALGYGRVEKPNVNVAGLEPMRDELDAVFEGLAGSEKAWKRRKAELQAVASESGWRANDTPSGEWKALYLWNQGVADPDLQARW